LQPNFGGFVYETQYTRFYARGNSDRRDHPWHSGGHRDPTVHQRQPGRSQESSLLSQLQTLRSQIELYKLQHKDALPDLVTNWNPMTTKTDIDGTTVGALDFGPYMQSAPTNPVNTLSNVTNGDSALAVLRLTAVSSMTTTLAPAPAASGAPPPTSAPSSE
jgi:type II secretory pathway pseudopilin PulG